MFEQLRKVRTIVSHANCPDGLASAIICKEALSRSEPLQIKMVQHGTKEKEELVAEEGMLFVDITPPSSRIDEFVKAGAIVLDHHIQTKEDVEKFGPLGVFANEKTEPGVSGAVLAFRHMWEVLRIETAYEVVKRFAYLAGVRDTWQKNSPDWEEACLQANVLMFYPKKYTLEQMSFFSEWPRMMELGPVLRLRDEERDQRLLEDVLMMVSSKGTKVALIPSTGISDCADRIDADIAVGFAHHFKDSSRIVFSTRSRGRFDCGKFCKSLGGGGHTNAAGFHVVGRGDPVTIFLNLLDSYERVTPG